MQIIEIDSQNNQIPKNTILIIYTGGTLGMVRKKNTLIPFNFENIIKKIPEISQVNCQLHIISLDTIIDSSNVTPQHWIKIAAIIAQYYNEYQGFVILHGTDTMAYSASALSYIFKDISKPIIFTGAQLPIGAIRNDARRNLITAIEVAAQHANHQAEVPEVCIFFNDFLLRGNRARKIQSNYFDAFQSENYPHLAQVGTKIIYNHAYIRAQKSNTTTPSKELVEQIKFEQNVLILKIFPGITHQILQAICINAKPKGIILETYGSGNAPTEKWFLKTLEDTIKQGTVILNVSQCVGGTVEQGKYQTSQYLEEIGVLSGKDITSEAAITKMMYLLAQNNNPLPTNHLLTKDIAGEMTNNA
ncbi:MAG: asparaginase [Cytophagales bacterium]|nr:MAG: asparaginase [Cytophagales bacterium]